MLGRLSSTRVRGLIPLLGSNLIIRGYEQVFPSVLQSERLGFEYPYLHPGFVVAGMLPRVCKT
jgi:hypothetical protein